MTGQQTRRLDDNLELRGSQVHCQRCDERVGSNQGWLEFARFVERPAPPGHGLTRVAPELFVDTPVVQRQAFCPGCLTLLLTEVIAADDRGWRTKRLADEEPGSSGASQ
jgi:hypothetical protein